MSNDKEAFAVAMFGLAEEFGGTLTENNLKLKWESLKRFPIQDVTRGISFLIENRTKTHPLVPTTKEIIEAIEVVQSPELAINPDHLAELQANEVLAFLHANGSGAAPDFKDPLTQSLMTRVWPYASWGKTLTEKEKPWWRKEFIRTYKAYSDSARIYNRLNLPEQLFQIASGVVKQIAHTPSPQIEWVE